MAVDANGADLRKLAPPRRQATVGRMLDGLAKVKSLLPQNYARTEAGDFGGAVEADRKEAPRSPGTWNRPRRARRRSSPTSSA